LIKKNLSTFLLPANVEDWRIACGGNHNSHQVHPRGEVVDTEPIGQEWCQEHFIHSVEHPKSNNQKHDAQNRFENPPFLLI
jgi:hypothetical protein